jgi:hypothetical protein
MENPYQSPNEPWAMPAGQLPMRPQQRPPGLVSHVRAVAILMLIQGALELVAGFGFGVMAVVMPQVIARDMRHAANPPHLPPHFSWIFTAEFGVMAAAALVPAMLHIVAGLQNYRFRGRTLGIVALAAGMATFFTCFCLPTAIALGVYGLIVYLNASVSEAFCMGEAGCSSNEVLITFRR